METSSFTTDHRGTPLTVGKRVAFNRSGDVVIGTILEIKKNKVWQEGYRNRNDFEMHVTNEDDKVSKIKNYSSFVIID